MKDEDILKIAMQCDPEFTRRTYYLDLLNFGAAIAAAEREACAKTCEELGPEMLRWWGNGQANAAATECANAIRMRSNV